jgi:hypothetical protein
MALSEGTVAWVQNSQGVFKLSYKASGKWSNENVKDMVKALIEAKANLSSWSVWLDFGLESPILDAKVTPQITAKEFAAYIKMADKLEIVHCRGKFPQPKLKLTKGSGSTQARKATATVI